MDGWNNATALNETVDVNFHIYELSSIQAHATGRREGWLDTETLGRGLCERRQGTRWVMERGLELVLGNFEISQSNSTYHLTA